MSERTTAHIYVSGEVQGVGFRYWTHRAANQAGVSGWVRNLPDGRVEAVLDGDPDDVHNVVEWCRKGPSSAFVSGVEVDDHPDVDRDFDSFEVR